MRSSSTTSIIKDNRCAQRINQQKVIQDKLFDRYKIESKQGSNQKHEKSQTQFDQNNLEDELIIIQHQEKTPERLKSQRSAVTPDQK